MSEEICGSCGAPGPLWDCNGYSAEVCEHSACSPSDDDPAGWDDLGRWLDAGPVDDQPNT